MAITHTDLNTWLKELEAENKSLTERIDKDTKQRSINEPLISGIRAKLGLEASPQFATQVNGQASATDIRTKIVAQVRQMNGSDITVADIRNIFPDVERSTISGTLSSLSDANGILRLTRKGVGRRPAIYRLK